MHNKQALEMVQIWLLNSHVFYHWPKHNFLQLYCTNNLNIETAVCDHTCRIKKTVNIVCEIINTLNGTHAKLLKL